MTSRQIRKYALAAVASLATAALLVTVSTTVSPASAAETVDPRLALAQQNVQAYCTDLVDDATTSRQHNTRYDLCQMWRRQLADLTATPTPSVSPTATPAPPPTTTPPATTTPPPTTTPAPTPTGWPDAGNTGVPPFAVLTLYTGSCTVTTPDTVIDLKTVNCDLVIKANNVRISRSKVNGTISSGGGQYHFDVVDSEVDASPGSPRQVTAVGGENFTILRGNIRGGNRAVYCEHYCTVQDSWLHGQEILDPWHASAIRLSQYATIIHNRLACDAAPVGAEGGCSGNQVGYPDFEPTHDWLVEGNLFTAQIGASYCAYAGNTQGKAYSSDTSNATNIVYRDNVFERGSNGKCGYYGPVTDFAAGRPGNLWSGNVWSSGEPVVAG